MINNSFKVILRYLLRSPFFTGLNVLGLSIGLGCCVIIFLFAQHELSYDSFHRDRNEIYRVTRKSAMSGAPYSIGVTSGPFAEALKLDFNDRIQDVTRAFPCDALVQYQDKSIIEEKLLLADKNFFQFFSYPLAKGDPATVLSAPGGMVVTQAFATKYFGDENPVGKILRVDNTYDLQITGVMDELPGNTHLQFDAVGSIALIEKEPWYQEWWNNSSITYTKVASMKDVNFLREAFPGFMDKYFGKDFERVGNRIGLDLEPLTEIYFNNATRYDRGIVHGDRRYVYIFVSVGVMLMLLAAMNYINLATAQTANRAKEVGIRKTLGSTKTTIATQFLSESFLLCFVSMLLGMGLAQLAIPLLNGHFGLAIPNIFSNINLVYFVLTLLLLISLLAGSYPSFILSSLKPARIVKGVSTGDLSYLLIRKITVIFQFSISIFMIIATLFIGKQLRFMQRKDLGFSPEKVVIVPLNNPTIQHQRHSFKTRMLTLPGIETASLSSGHPGGFYDASTVTVKGEENTLRMRTLAVDEDMLTTMDIAVANGRFFSRLLPGDSIRSVVLNETAVRELGWTLDEALGKEVKLAQFDSIYKVVVGVVKDYNFTSLKEKIEPLIISYHQNGRNLLIRLAGDDLQQSIASLQRLWNSYETGYPMELKFLDDTLEHLYKTETVQGNMFAIFSIISLIIACLGILGLASFMASQRRKEIGIRKVLGASVKQLSVLVMKDLLALVMMAVTIAIPLGYWAIREWSRSFAYRVPMGPMIFVGGAAIVFVFALLIVGLNASRIARQDPVKSLRPE